MSKITFPAELILSSAFASFTFSIFLWFTGQREEGMFVGLWVPSILVAGQYFVAPSVDVEHKRESNLISVPRD